MPGYSRKLYAAVANFMSHLTTKKELRKSTRMISDVGVRYAALTDIRNEVVNDLKSLDKQFDWNDASFLREVLPGGLCLGGFVGCLVTAAVFGSVAAPLCVVIAAGAGTAAIVSHLIGEHRMDARYGLNPANQEGYRFSDSIESEQRALRLHNFKGLLLSSKADTLLRDDDKFRNSFKHAVAEGKATEKLPYVVTKISCSF